jgi:bis(5'-nucleosyl)-tetraphosphatase (symmetrical)
MKTYIVGDVHGQNRALGELLETCGFHPDRDRLWFVGDLVNRGPDSLGVLHRVHRLAQEMGDRLLMVLGNHDLHLVALGEGLMDPRPKDSDLEPLLAAPELEEFLRWLASCPLLHREGDHLVVHAGLLPHWSAEDAEHIARRVEAALRDAPTRAALLARETPEDPELLELWRALEAFTRNRTLDAQSLPCAWKGPPEGAPEGCTPWFRFPGRQTAGLNIFCGHWAALGCHQENGVVVLDGGAAWGGKLTALRLEDGEVFETPAEKRDR